MIETIEKRVKEVNQNLKPRFISPDFLTYEQLTDPDYILKLLQGLYGGKYAITCSKCHHCR